MSIPMVSKSIGLNEAQENYITAVAKKMNGWLMDVPLKVGLRVPGYAFKSDLSEDADQSGLRIGHLLANYPRLSYIKTGKLKMKMSGPVFRESDVAYETAETAYNEKWLPFSAGSANVLSNFPYAEATLKDMMAACKCSSCGKDGGELQACKRGCLRHFAVTRLFLLLAHAIVLSLFTSRQCVGILGFAWWLALWQAVTWRRSKQQMYLIPVAPLGQLSNMGILSRRRHSLTSEGKSPSQDLSASHS